MDEATSIEVPELIAIGAAVTGVAGRLDRAAGAIEGWQSAADDAVDGSVTCAGALANTAMHWQRALTGLAAEIRDYGAELHRAAVDYRAADEFAARRLHAAAPGRPVPQ